MNTRSNIANVNVFYDKRMLYKAKPHLVHMQFCQVNNVPNKNSSTIAWRRYELLAPALTPLQEGLTPPGSNLTITNITGQLYQYGDFTIITDALEYTTEDPLLQQTNDILAQQAANTLDIITREEMNSGTSVTYASTAVNRGQITAAMKLTVTEVREAVRNLKLRNALRLVNLVDPTTGIDTTPIPTSFIGIVHPNTTLDLKGDPNFIEVQKYPNQSRTMEGEVGTMDEVRFIETTNAKVFYGEGLSGADVYSTLVIGKYFAAVSNIGQTIQTIYKELGSGGTADPLNQRSSYGWKTFFGATILNENFAERIEHGATA